jgi:hypothetical protein
MDPLAGPPDVLARHLAREIDTWGRLVREAGLVAQ